jgi:hypothetical protein
MLLEEIYCKYFVVKAVRYNNVTQVAQRFRVFVIDHKGMNSGLGVIPVITLGSILENKRKSQQ